MKSLSQFHKRWHSKCSTSWTSSWLNQIGRSKKNLSILFSRHANAVREELRCGLTKRMILMLFGVDNVQLKAMVQVWNLSEWWQQIPPRLMWWPIILLIWVYDGHSLCVFQVSFNNNQVFCSNCYAPLNIINKCKHE